MKKLFHMKYQGNRIYQTGPQGFPLNGDNLLELTLIRDIGEISILSIACLFSFF